MPPGCDCLPWDGWLHGSCIFSLVPSGCSRYFPTNLKGAFNVHKFFPLLNGFRLFSFHRADWNTAHHFTVQGKEARLVSRTLRHTRKCNCERTPGERQHVLTLPKLWVKAEGLESYYFTTFCHLCAFLSRWWFSSYMLKMCYRVISLIWKGIGKIKILCRTYLNSFSHVNCLII